MTPEQREANTTRVVAAPPVLRDTPTAYLNPGLPDDRPFAVVELGVTLWLYIHEPAHARAIAAAFTKAADLLDDHAAQSPEQPPPDAGDSADPPPLSRDLSGDLDAIPSHRITEEGGSE